MMRKFFLIFLLTYLTINSHAQMTGFSVHENLVKKDTSMLAAYTDSLLILRQKLFESSASISEEYKMSATEQARIFLPTTYYREVIDNLFSLYPNSEPESDKYLLEIYMKSPFLVRTTDRELHNQRATLVDVEKPIRHDVEIVEKEAPLPVEATSAPVEVMVLKPNFWTYKGDYSLQILQNYISGNWYQGGESNYSALTSVLMEANFNNKQKIKWDNRLELKFGLQSSKSDSLHNFKTTEDLFRVTSKFGVQANKRWYYATQLIAYSQFTHSYRSNDPSLYADFLAPFNLNLSLGMDYSVDWLKHKLKGNIHLAPIAYNMKYTRLKRLATRLGLEEGRHIKHDFGSEFTLDLRWQLMEMLSWKTRLYGYTSYERSELEWENTFTFKFNKYISAQIFIYPRFDDGVVRDEKHGYWQLKEFASLGFLYSF